MEELLRILEKNARMPIEDIAAMLDKTPEEIAAMMDEAAAKAAGAEGVIRPAKNACQVVIKGDVQAVYDALRKQL